MAFEAFDRLGRGVVIDDIVVRSKPVCNAPSAIMFTDIANTTATMVWAASFDAVATEIKVSSRPLNADSLADGTAVGDILDERFTPDVMMYNLTGLDWATQYYVYARSVCGDGDDIDYSVWASGIQVYHPG